MCVRVCSQNKTTRIHCSVFSLWFSLWLPLILYLSTLWTSLAAPTAVPFLSQKLSECPTNIWLWELERGAESSAFVLSVGKNKLIHAELNSRVQLDNQDSPGGSMNFSVFMSGFSTATLTFTKNWEPLEEVCIFTSHERLFKFSCGLVPGGKSPFGGLVLSQGSGTSAEGSRCLFFRSFPLAFPHTAQGTGTPFSSR